MGYVILVFVVVVEGVTEGDMVFDVGIIKFLLADGVRALGGSLCRLAVNGVLIGEVVGSGVGRLREAVLLGFLVDGRLVDLFVVSRAIEGGAIT